MSDLDRSVHAQLRGLLDHSGSVAPPGQVIESDRSCLEFALRLLSKWRSLLIQNTLLQHQGTIVSGGPFRGMQFVRHSSEGCHVPKLLGCYEQPLHGFLEDIADQDYRCLVNIGCAEGYYAVGMALRFPSLRVVACDTNEGAREATARLARLNGVADRVEVLGHFRPSDFERFADLGTLVICDIEGGEAELLDPAVAPSLAGVDLVVEAHDCFQPGISALLSDRFADTHSVDLIVDDGGRVVAHPPAWFSGLGHLDQLLATWEWRSGPTPWLILRHNPSTRDPGNMR